MRAAHRITEPRRVTLVTTPGPGGHVHMATFDEGGDGRTDTVDGHFHLITALEVLAAPVTGGHVHELTDTRGADPHGKAMHRLQTAR